MLMVPRIQHLCMEARLPIGVILDRPHIPIALQQRIFTLHNIPLALLFVFLHVVRLRIVHRIRKLVMNVFVLMVVMVVIFTFAGVMAFRMVGLVMVGNGRLVCV